MSRLRVVALMFALSGCAHRYMLVSAASALNCPTDDLVSKERKADYRVEGCGRWVTCKRVWWSGYDDWVCERHGDVAPEPAGHPGTRSATLPDCLDECRGAYEQCTGSAEDTGKDCRYETDMCRESCRARHLGEAQPAPPP